MSKALTGQQAADYRGWAIIEYRGYDNVIVRRAAYREPFGWVNTPGISSRQLIAAPRVIAVIPMRVAADDEVIVKAVDIAPTRHLSIAS